MTTMTQTTTDYATARRAMIDSQLRTSGVTEGFVLERMNAVGREDFVPQTARETAYVDRAIPLGEGRFLAAPLVHGMMLAEARPTADDRVLVIDGGSGYLPALVKPLCGSVTVMPADEAAATAKRDKYTLVLVDGAVEHIPANVATLVANRGRIVTGVIERGVTRLASGCKSDGSLALLPLAEIGIPRLPAFDAPKGWSF